MFPDSTALIVIDLQKAIDHPSWGRRNNPQAEENIARLIDAWRRTKRWVIHVQHHSRESQSTYSLGQPGVEFKDGARPAKGETVVTKHVTSAFIGTDLEEILCEAGHHVLVIVGVTTNNSVEATARVAGNLGFEVYVVSDATFTFDRAALDGSLHKAEDVHAHSLANLNREYARIIDTDSILDRVL